MESVDLVIIGAGLHGLCVAKTYLEIHPYATLLILDSAQSVGGTWATERLYPNLHSNNMLGTYEFSDFPMDPETFGVKPGEHIPGVAIQRYLTAYAENFGVHGKIRFETTVESAELIGGGTWLVRYVYGSSGKNEIVGARKLVIATGMTSQVNMPVIKGSENFKGRILHAKEMANNKMLEHSEHAVVLGGSKSAADAVYTNASKGNTVDWVIRKSGKGPYWITPAYVTPLKLWLEKLTTVRFLTFFSPYLDSTPFPGPRAFLHGTAIGRAITRAFWWVLNNDVVTLTKYNEHPETKKLLPFNTLYWSGTGLSILNFEKDFLGLVRDGRIRVHIADITHLEENKVHLSDGSSLETEILVCATGWKYAPPFKFLPEKIQDRTGMFRPEDDPQTIARADKEIMERFPVLLDQPTCAGCDVIDEGGRAGQMSYALYRGVVPPAFVQSRNLAYAGVVMSTSTTLIAQVQALWIVAFLSGELDIDSNSQSKTDGDDIMYEAVLQSRFYRWRAPNGNGTKVPDMVFEVVPYIDNLLKDLKLNWCRKGGWREWFVPYGLADYVGLVGEWASRRKKN